MLFMFFESNSGKSQTTPQSDGDQAQLIIQTLEKIYERDDCPKKIKDNLSLVIDLLRHVVNKQEPLAKAIPTVIGFYNWVAAQYPVGTESSCYSFCDFEPVSGSESTAKELLEYVKKIGDETDQALSNKGLPAGTVVKYARMYRPDGRLGGNLDLNQNDILFTRSQLGFLAHLGEGGVKMSPKCFSRSPIPGLEDLLSNVPALNEAFESAKIPSIQCK